MIDQPQDVAQTSIGDRRSSSVPRLPQKSLRGFRVPLNVIQRLPAAVASELTMMPLAFDGETLHVAVADPNDFAAQDKVRFLLNVALKAYTFPRDEIKESIEWHYGRLDYEAFDSMLQDLDDAAIDFTETADYSVDNCSLKSHGSRATQNRRRAPAEFKRGASLYRSLDPGDGMFYYTIEEGQKVLAHHRSGKLDVLQGPQRIWKGWTRFERMTHLVAHSGQYLEVRMKDGRQENLSGPTEIWLDPRIHAAIDVKECITLAAKEAVVVYGADEAGTTVRRVIYGPGMYVPKPGEWLHTFSWHASQGGSKGVQKRPNALKFQKLWLLPDQMYHDVHDVRTSDDAVLTIRLMIFFELVHIDRMLDTTHDPIGDFVNAATSDVVGFTGRHSFEAFKQETEQLNRIETYQQLLHRAEQCGYRVSNVVYRGYGAPESLQSMHDEAIQSRTRLQLERATERQAQELEDYKLQCQMERSARRREEQTNEIEHDLDLRRRRHAEQMRQKEAAGVSLRRERQLEAELTAQIAAATDAQQRTHLAELKNLQIDLTALLTQGRADQVIELRGGQTQAHLHLNSNDR